MFCKDKETPPEETAANADDKKGVTKVGHFADW